MSYKKGDRLYSATHGLCTVVDGRKRRHTDGDWYIYVQPDDGDESRPHKQWTNHRPLKLTPAEDRALQRFSKEGIDYLIRQFFLGKVVAGVPLPVIAEQLELAARLI